jgi:hypothetical protein
VRPGRRTNSVSAKRGMNFEHVVFYRTSKVSLRKVPRFAMLARDDHSERMVVLPHA